MIHTNFAQKPLRVLTSLGVTDFNINRSSIRRHRMLLRTKFTASLMAEFTCDNPLIVHWDGKLISDSSMKEHVDRFPIIISGQGISQLLKVAKIPTSTDKEQAWQTKAFEEWGLVD